MAQTLQRAWLRRGGLAAFLWPVSLLFGLLVWVRRTLYRLGLLKATRIPVPVVVVGNVIVGGAGKTPLVLAVLEHLRTRGVRAGVVSRGHGRSTSDCREVTSNSPAELVGDEPLLVARRSGVPVFVATRRADAARALLEAHPDVKVVVCDDGLQHHALERDIEICVFDERGVGNGWLLPAGPLREPWPRRVDLVVRLEGAPGIAGHVIRRTLADHALQADGTPIPLAELTGREWTAVAGIAKPQVFFAMLRQRGLKVTRALAFPDHHAFTAASLGNAAPHGEGLLCTEKDAVKLWPLRPQALAVPLQVKIDHGFWTAFDALLDAKLSSADGRQTA